jgi:hypothetical protein
MEMAFGTAKVRMPPQKGSRLLGILIEWGERNVPPNIPDTNQQR